MDLPSSLLEFAIKKFNLLVRFIIVATLAITSVSAAEMCTSDGTATFTTATTNYTNTVSNLPKFDSDYYYFNIETAGTLTITVTSGGNKIDLAYSDSTCPTASATGVYSKVVTATAPMDLNIALYSTNNSGYIITATFVPAPVVSINCPSNSIIEGDITTTTTTCTISLDTTPLFDDIQLQVKGVDVSSSNGTDYNATDTNITFVQNTATLSQNYSFDVIGDTIYEGNESFNIRVENNPAYSSTTQLRDLPDDYNVTIIDDDPIPSLLISIENTAVTEEDNGTLPMNFPFILSAPTTTDITVTYQFNDIDTDSSDTNMTNGNVYSFVIPSASDVGLFVTTLIAVTGDTFVESNETFSITLLTTTEGTIDPTSHTAIGTIYDNDGAGGGVIIPAYNPGTVDAIDIYTTTMSTPFYEQVIKTKITGQTNLTLDAVYLGVNAPYVPTMYTAANMPVIMYLYDPIANTVDKLYEPDGTTPLAAVITTDSYSGTTPLFTMPPTAKKQAYILMRYLDYYALELDGGPICLRNSSTGANAVPGMPSCVASNHQYLDAFHQEAYDRCKVQHGEPCKPQHHGYSGGGDTSYPGYDEIYDHKYGCYECTLGATPLVRSVDNFSIKPASYNATFTPAGNLKAGNDFNLTLTARTEANTAITGYNGDAIITPMTQISSCPVPDGDLTDSVGNPLSARVFDGIDTNVSYNSKFGDVGVFDMNVTDSTWTAVDSVKNECIPNSNSTVPDASGKVGCLVQTTFNPVVIPDHFAIDGNFTNGSSSKLFTYLNNFEGNAALDQNISALMDWNVTAQAAGNAPTANYISTCYAKDGNISLTPDLGAHNIVDINDSLSKLLWYDETNNTIIGTTPIEGPYILPNYTAEHFVPGDSNGTGNFRYRLNFDRNLTKSVNPFRMTINNMIIIDSDSVTGNNLLDKNATYVFGRTHASRQRYDIPTGTANIYFENYCFGTGCIKALINGFTSTNTDDIRWFINTAHTSTDGVTGTAVEKNSIDKVREISPTTIFSPPSPRVEKTLEYKDNGTDYADNSYPYKTTMENDASPWLIYNEDDPTATRNEFQVEFGSSSSWSGERDTNTTTRDVGAVRTNRRSNW